MNRSELPFDGRLKDPAPDPLNALLSFGYTLVMNQIRSLAEGLGFELSQLFAKNRIDAEQPLSAKSFAFWRESINPKREEVAVYLDRDVIRISTEAAFAPRAGQIRQATLSLRKSDWHPVAQTILARSAAGEDAEFEIQETSFSVLPMNLVPLGIFEPVEVLPIETKHVNRVTASSTENSFTPQIPTPTDEQLEDVELRLREALHQVEADLQEMSQIERENHEVHLRLWAQSGARKAEILAALEGIPFISPDIYNAEVAVTNFSPSVPTTQSVARLYLNQPPLAEALSKYLGGVDITNNYLSEIRDSYLREQRNHLAADLQNRLNGLAADHAAKMQLNASAYLKLQSFVLDEMLRKYGSP